MHTESEKFAALAEESLLRHEAEQALQYYRRAAEAETTAIKFVAIGKYRTLAVSYISAAALWFKAGEYRRAQTLAAQGLGQEDLPEFAKQQLKEILQTAWNEEVAIQSGGQFAREEILVNVSGGVVVEGGAPMELIQRKIDEISRIVLRVIEFVLVRPFRVSGAPDPDVTEYFRPWLFHAPAGSYQFAIRVETPQQQELFKGMVTADSSDVTKSFMAILDACITDPSHILPDIVTDSQYRSAFVRLSRNLAPTANGKLFERLTVRTSGLNTKPIVITSQAREVTGRVLKEIQDAQDKKHANTIKESIAGVLRAVELDKDWLTVRQEDGKTIKIYKAGDAIDDIVGPMVNQRVVVDVSVRKNKRYFSDIQPLE